MNDDKFPQSNINERLQKIAEAQKEIHEVTPSPEQIAYEQVLEMQAQNEKSASATRTVVADLKESIPTAVEAKLNEHRTKEKQSREVSETKITTAIDRLKPTVSNEELRNRMTVWGTTLVILAIAAIFVLFLTRR